MKHNINI